MLNDQFSIFIFELSSNSYHAPVMNFFRMKMLEIGCELSAQLFCLTANILMN